MVVILAFALSAPAFFSYSQLVLLLVIALLFLVAILVVLEITTFFLIALKTVSLLNAYEFDDGSLINAFLLVVEREASAVEDGPYAFAVCVGVRFGISEEFEFGVDIAAVLRGVCPCNVYWCYGGVSARR